MERRLAAVLIADVVGYVRLSQADEEGTRTRFQTDLHEVFEPAIRAHRGRLVKTMGDAMLVEFHSVVDAERCAVEVQRSKAERNAGVPEAKRLVYRIGINLGDVIVEGDDIHGDGVNIADRLQELADPGGVTISGTAYDQVKTKVEVGYAYQGEQRVKHVADPVRVYRVLIDPTAAGKTIGVGKTGWRLWRWPAAAAVLVALIAAGFAVWQRPWEPIIEAAAIERMALPLPDKPSIVVLPFDNMGGNAEEDYFADGITEDLTTDLSRLAGLFVISRNTAFTYKGKAVKPAQISEELGVRYILEGSVRRGGDGIRINAQLIDALSGGHVWADRYDGSIADIFALQDKVTNAIVDALALHLTNVEQRAIAEQETSVPAAYDAFLRGWMHYRRTTPEDFAKAIPYFEEATKLDPEYGRAYAALAIVYARIHEKFWSDRIGLTQAESYERATKYLEEAKKHPTTLSHQAAGILLWERFPLPEYALKGSAEMMKAIEIDSGDPFSYAYLGLMLIAAGRSDEAIPHLRTAMRLDPHFPTDFTSFLGLAQLSLEQFDQAAASFETAAKRNPEDTFPLVPLAIAYAYLGRTEEAAALIAHVNELWIAGGYMPIHLADMPYLGYRTEKDLARVRKGLDLAGVPETLFQGEFADRNRLAADEIRALVFGHRLHGRTSWSSYEYAASITLDGAVTASGEWTLINGGVAEFEGDTLCVKNSYSKSCMMILRIPGGTKAKENEYLLVLRSRVFTFSQVD